MGLVLKLIVLAGVTQGALGSHDCDCVVLFFVVDGGEEEEEIRQRAESGAVLTVRCAALALD
jgi:hypothetical protein